MDIVSRLAEFFKQFPGIGPRQAKRFVFFLLTQSDAYRKEFARLVTELGKSIEVCTSCRRFFPVGSVQNADCLICRDPNRSNETLLVVSRDVDFENIEKSRSFNGKYFILGGSIPILEKNPETKIRLKELLSLIEKMVTPKMANVSTQGVLKEVILALNLTPEGENTHDFLTERLAPLAEKYGIKLSTLGRGLSTGLELEYSDSETIKNALKNRA